MTKKTGLGRGLSAILPDSDGEPFSIGGRQSADRDVVREIPIGLIDPNRAQPRRKFDPESLSALADSIKSSGILQPLLLAPQGSRYTIIAGERRWRAARLAGLSSVPAIVREWDEVKRREAALIENIQRENLNPMEEAAGIRSLMDECGLTQDKAAERLGRSRPAVANLLRLLSLPKDMQEAVADSRLSAGHARVLCGVADAGFRKLLYERTLAEGWPVRRLEEEAKKPRREKPGKKPAPALPPEYRELCDRLSRATGRKANLLGGEKRGRVILTYGSPEELQRLWDLIGEV